MSLRRTPYLAGALLVLTTSVSLAAPRGMVRIEAGSFRPLYAQPGEKIVHVAAFALDTVPVSQAGFLAFVRQQPRWAKGKVPGLFADAQYLQRMTGSAEHAVTSVSWFAAEAYCKARGARLPTTSEWEYVARASETQRSAVEQPDFKQRVLDMALARRAGSFRIGSGLRNVWGVRDLHGGIGEWTLDFHTIFGDTDSRRSGHTDRTMTCAAGAVETGDASDYAAFMRYAFRAGASGRTTSTQVGFRCAASL